ncbi:hypothetical protein VB712_10465 [Spirulina sp. CCNP1310]|uniref:hypothetical protein n=1 Tax=Spirulina sp. CCNP1310 TaxID=3110249 RepID=UPI002B21686B|nr:hypothetical protein [Spirulina sp. CCNP1310]MEA5419646.1 hypothetical protein [Spirulina sp. CCNP1310]
MTKFWFMTYSTTAALGWVALGSTGAQAVDSLPPEELTGESLQLAQVDRDAMATAQPSLLQDTVIVEVEPTPSVEFSPLAPATAYQGPLPPVPEVTPAPSNHAPAFIEQDPTLRAAINPQTPSQRATIRATPPESLIRDGRSFEELIAPSSEQNRQRTAGAPEQITTRTARSAVLEAEPMVRQESNPVLAQQPPASSSQRRDTAPLLQKLEQDLQQIRREITGSTRPLALDSPLITLTPLPDLGDYQYFSDRNPNAPRNSTAWEAVSLSREFALSTFDATTPTLDFAALDMGAMATNFADLGLQFFSDRLASDVFLGNAHFFDFERVALTFTDLATEFTGMFTDWEPLLTAETGVPVAELAPETTVFNVTPTAADYFAQYHPANPLTFGFKPDFTL